MVSANHTAHSAASGSSLIDRYSCMRCHAYIYANDTQYGNPSPSITKKGLEIAHLNIISLLRHQEELTAFLMSEPLDILCLTETNLCSDIEDHELQISGYVVAAIGGTGTGMAVAFSAMSLKAYGANTGWTWTPKT